MRGFRKVDRLSTWRRVALHAWRAPNDPTVHGSLELDVGEALELLKELRAKTGLKLTVTHLVGRAIALAIRERPEVNAIVRFGRLYQRDSIDVFFQVAFEGGENLGGHKVAGADRKSLVEIARELAEGASKVRRKEGESVKAASKFRLMPAPLVGAALKVSTALTYDLGLDLSGLGIPFDGFGSVMVTNVGGFGLTSGFPPILPFARCPLLILVGEVQQRPWVYEGEVVPRPVLPLGVTFDHRLLDGYQAGVLAKKFREVLERPRAALAEEIARA
jgi:pyruvate dehydrogenase E2 component (dihydrolipoamide acetyltransferase)